ncbi:MAG: murein L,D-transpeptidase family protein [Steroidobacteraceae bacterium]
MRSFGRLAGSIVALLAGACIAPPVAADGLSGAQRVAAVQPATESLPVADRVLVLKGERRLQLLRHGEVLREYRIALGLNPVGHKERSGDFRTPEGSYFLTRRNPRSDFFLAIQVSYPNATDLSRARRNGWQAGGAIMIHGLPNELTRTPEYYERTDWTDGCIAVSNADMLEIWLMTPDNVPIDIRP